jgi:hypothetical protein
MQANCDLPPTCPSAACASVFIPFMEDCETMLSTMPGVPLADFQSFASSCVELQAGAGQMLQPVAVQMFRVLVNTEMAQTGSMFPTTGGGGEPLDPLHLNPVPPPAPPATGGNDDTTDVSQYHAVCSSADIANCVPSCNIDHHGFELLATIDGMDTKFSCNLAHGLYSWMGAASDGGYLGIDVASFFSAVVSAAAGSYILTLTTDARVDDDLTIQPGQNVQVSGDRQLANVPTWGARGSFRVRSGGALLLEYVAVMGSVSVDGGGSLIMQDMSGVGEAVIISAQANAAITASGLHLNGVDFRCPGDGAASCVQNDGIIQISGPHGVTIDSHGQVTAAQQDVQYTGADGYALSTRVQTGAAGLYQGLGITQDPGVSAPMTVHAAQSVQVIADRTLATAPVWGTGAFIVQETGSLSLSWMDIPGDITTVAGSFVILVGCIIRGAVTVAGDIQASSTLFAEGSSFRMTGDATGTMQDNTFARTAVSVDGELSLGDVDLTCGSSFEVVSGGSVTISNSTLGARIEVDQGGNLQLATSLSADFPYTNEAVEFDVDSSGVFTTADTSTFHPQCFQPYELLTDAWRKASADGGTSATDSRLNNRWFRVAGEAGTRLSTKPPGFFHCGTSAGGWLSSCPQEGLTPSCNAHGRFPMAQDGVVQQVVCFDVGNGMPCLEKVVAQVVNCGAFTLAQLPNAPDGPRAYCTE